MAHEKTTGKAQDRTEVCAVCNQSIPLDIPCTNEQCPVKVAAAMRTAAAKTSFRLGC